ncbi:MAG: NADH-quinone oxidoreductase subunit NuoF [Ignavibacteria bacterium]|nr:NADH-quinone oxidoreductase subunit NuoF [Ignavibacteria bacterium]
MQLDFTEKLILPNISNLHQLSVYEENGGYQAIRKAFTMQPDAVTNEVKQSNLRGRGGACFPTGLKWTFMPKSTTADKQTEKPKYLCCNADESEPGTFKDRQIIEFNPHLLIEGILCAAYAMGIKSTYIYIRGEYYKWYKILQNAVEEAYAKNYIGEKIFGTEFSTDIVVHRGAGAYICGEESALMNSVEGKRGYPRVKPPFPAAFGLWGCPTTINNVETLCNVPHIINRGWEWFSKIGSPKHPGTILLGVSGHVNKPGVYEFPTGILLSDLIYEVCGGIPGNKKIKAVIPGGSSTMWIRGEEIDGVRMDAESLKTVGTSIGTGGVIVMDEDTDVIKVLSRIAHFYHHESCGQCTPCREGTGWMEKILHNFESSEATLEDIDLLLDVANNIEGNTICALGDAAAWPVQSVIKKFRGEFERRVRKSPKVSSSIKPPHLVFAHATP